MRNLDVFRYFMVEIVFFFYFLFHAGLASMFCVGGSQPKIQQSIVVGCIVFCRKKCGGKCDSKVVWGKLLRIGRPKKICEGNPLCMTSRVVGCGAGPLVTPPFSGSRSVLWSAVLLVLCSVNFQHSCCYLFACDKPSMTIFKD